MPPHLVRRVRGQARAVLRGLPLHALRRKRRRGGQGRGLGVPVVPRHLQLQLLPPPQGLAADGWGPPACSTAYCAGAHHVILCTVHRCSPRYPPHGIPVLTTPLSAQCTGARHTIPVLNTSSSAQCTCTRRVIHHAVYRCSPPHPLLSTSFGHFIQHDTTNDGTLRRSSHRRALLGFWRYQRGCCTGAPSRKGTHPWRITSC